MPQTMLDGQPDHERGSAVHGLSANSALQTGPVVVVGRSPVNLIVLSRIAERARMKVFTDAPDKAGRLIEQCRPAIVILDGGADLHECDAALGAIMAQKLMTGGVSPFVIMLTPNNQRPEAILSGGTIDALVSKPVTPERLQPLLEQIRDRNQG